MKTTQLGLLAAGAAVAVLAVGTAQAEKAGGILKVYHTRTPSTASIHDSSSTSTLVPYMAVYNNLVMFDQSEPLTSLDTIVPDLAESWSWNDDGTELTFKLREGVRWHDGQPFTSADVRCTWNLLMGKGEKKLRSNAREAWYGNLEEVTTNGDHEATFHLGRKQPAFLALLASGLSPVYPCHVDPADMRTKPIGTGPFKFGELVKDQHLKLVKNENYWKEGRPLLDGIEYTIIKSPATRQLAFATGEFDLSFTNDVKIPQHTDLAAQAPDVVCELRSGGASANLLVNRDAPPFDNPGIREAFALVLDREAFISILGHGKTLKGGAMLPPPEGLWGLPEDRLQQVAGFSATAEENIAQAQEIMKGLGYGPDNKLKLVVSTRNHNFYRDPAVILVDLLGDIYVDADLEIVETKNWYGKLANKDFHVGMNGTGVGVDDPDVNFFENYACGSKRNYTGYCNRELEELFVKQSMMEDQGARRELVWQIDQKLQEDLARPIIWHEKSYQCRHPWVKGLTYSSNSAYNLHRYEDVWLDR